MNFQNQWFNFINERRGKVFTTPLSLLSIFLIPFLFNQKDQPLQEYHQLVRPFENIPFQLPVIRNLHPERTFDQPDHLSILHHHPIRCPQHLRQVNPQHQFRNLHLAIVRCPE